MTLQEIIADIHALREDLEAYESKYGVLSENRNGLCILWKMEGTP